MEGFFAWGFETAIGIIGLILVVEILLAIGLVLTIDFLKRIFK